MGCETCKNDMTEEAKAVVYTDANSLTVTANTAVTVTGVVSI